MRAALYDPQDIAGLATATVPPDAQKAEVITKNVGDTIVITIPSQELTMTASIAKTPANAVLLAAPTGQSTTLIMKKDGNVWKIDVAETEKASAAAARRFRGNQPAVARADCYRRRRVDRAQRSDYSPSLSFRSRNASTHLIAT